MLFKPLLLQSWTELDETNAISTRISLFPCRETQTRLQKWLPSPLSPTQLEGSRFHQSFLGGKATLIRGRGRKNWCGKWFSPSKFSFIPKCLNNFVRDCSTKFSTRVNVVLSSHVYELCMTIHRRGTELNLSTDFTNLSIFLTVEFKKIL